MPREVGNQCTLKGHCCGEETDRHKSRHFFQFFLFFNVFMQASQNLLTKLVVDRLRAINSFLERNS